jgi:hypothetical protein
MQGCIVVGSGTSAKGFVPPKGVPVIACNGAIDRLEKVDFFFTLDHSDINIKRLHAAKIGTQYFAAFPPKIKNVPAYVHLLKRYSFQGKEPVNKNSPEWWLWRWSAVLGLSEDKDVINSGNTAYGAVGLAYHLGFKKVLLIGVDASGDERIEGGKTHNLSHLPLLFESALSQIKIVNCGFMRSNVPTMSLKAGLKWLRGRDENINLA